MEYIPARDYRNRFSKTASPPLSRFQSFTLALDLQGRYPLKSILHTQFLPSALRIKSLGNLEYDYSTVQGIHLGSAASSCASIPGSTTSVQTKMGIPGQD